MPDDRSLRRRLPLWTEHWKKSKKSLLLQLIKHWSPFAWTRLLLRLLCLALLLYHVLLIARDYQRQETLSETSLVDPAHFQAPPISFCFPLVFCVSANHSFCPDFKLVFNQSLPFVQIRCKTTLKGGGVRDCPAPEHWLNRDQKCFTFFVASEESAEEDVQQMALHFFVHKSNDFQVFRLFFHAHNDFPLDDRSRPLHASRDSDSRLDFFATEEKRIQHCSDSPAPDHAPSLASGRSDCLFRCSAVRMRATCREGRHACVSRLSFVRETDFEGFASLCSLQSACNNHSFFDQHVLAACERACAPNCLRTHFHVSERAVESRDQSETNVTVTRSLTPDLRVKHVRRLEWTHVVALVGGVVGFWATVLWLSFRVLDSIRLLIEFSHIYSN